MSYSPRFTPKPSVETTEALIREEADQKCGTSRGVRYKVLIVDDSKTVRIIVKKALRTFDCEIMEAANGEEGLVVAAKKAPHLILLDVIMPVMDGVEMLTKLQSDPALKAIPVIMLTADAAGDPVRRIAGVSACDHVVKPFKEEGLIEACSRVLELKPVGDGGAKARSITSSAIPQMSER